MSYLNGNPLILYRSCSVLSVTSPRHKNSKWRSFLFFFWWNIGCLKFVDAEQNREILSVNGPRSRDEPMLPRGCRSGAARKKEFLHLVIFQLARCSWLIGASQSEIEGERGGMEPKEREPGSGVSYVEWAGDAFTAALGSVYSTSYQENLRCLVRTESNLHNSLKYCISHLGK